MKVLIVSDIHDNNPNLVKFLLYAEKAGAQALICAGDLTNEQTLARLASCGLPIHLVRGNACLYKESALESYQNIHYYGLSATFPLADHMVCLCHEPFRIEALLRNNACDILFFGHTHMPWEERRLGVNCLNPGSLSPGSSEATFAEWDTKSMNFSLIRVNLV